MLRRADVAMYQAKQQGPNRLFVYDALIDTIRHERLEIADDLRRALKADDLSVVYQPVLDANSRQVVGVEALLRWTRPQFGPVAPALFVAVAEETGLINELGAWTLRRACRDALAWPNLHLSVNVSPAQFRNPNFEIHLAGILAEIGFPAARLEIEITESYFIAHSDQAKKAIDAVRALGVAVALDDFGTGYSSIGYLRSFAFDKVKLDRSMLTGIVDDQRRHANGPGDGGACRGARPQRHGRRRRDRGGSERAAPVRLQRVAGLLLRQAVVGGRHQRAALDAAGPQPSDPARRERLGPLGPRRSAHSANLRALRSGVDPAPRCARAAAIDRLWARMPP